MRKFSAIFIAALCCGPLALAGQPKTPLIVSDNIDSITPEETLTVLRKIFFSPEKVEARAETRPNRNSNWYMFKGGVPEEHTGKVFLTVESQWKNISRQSVVIQAPEIYMTVNQNLIIARPNRNFIKRLRPNTTSRKVTYRYIFNLPIEKRDQINWRIFPNELAMEFHAYINKAWTRFKFPKYVSVY